MLSIIVRQKGRSSSLCFLHNKDYQECFGRVLSWVEKAVRLCHHQAIEGNVSCPGLKNS